MTTTTEISLGERIAHQLIRTSEKLDDVAATTFAQIADSSDDIVHAANEATKIQARSFRALAAIESDEVWEFGS